MKNFSGQLDDIISYVEKLNKVDTKKTPPTTHPFPLKNVFREDELKDSLPIDKVMMNAPKKKETFFKHFPPILCVIVSDQEGLYT